MPTARKTRPVRKAAVAVVALGALLGAAGIAVADDSGSSPSPSASASTAPSGTPKSTAPKKTAPSKDGAKKLCKRLPKAGKHLDRALHRLDGGAGTRGSVDRLEKRADKAKAAGHDEIAKYLGDKLTHRKSQVTTLQQRKTDLAKVKSWCGGQGA
jgi:hypothetical protein